MKRRRVLLLSLTVVLALCAACGGWLHRERQQYSLNRQLIVALTNSDTTRAFTLVNVGADPNTRLETTPAPTLPQLLKQLLHRTPLPVNDSPTAFLIACGASWPVGPNEGSRWMTLKENLPLLQAMLARGASVNARQYDGGTALHDAVAYDRSHTVELLLQHGADVNAQNAEGCAPLFLIGWNKTPKVAHMLLLHGANPNAQDKLGSSALVMVLITSQDRSLLTELLAHGADPNQSHWNDLTPLQWVQNNKISDLVRLLERRGRR